MKETFDAKLRNALVPLMPQAPEETPAVLRKIDGLYRTRPVPHTKVCEISLGWSMVCDCGADDYNRSLQREQEAAR